VRTGRKPTVAASLAAMLLASAAVPAQTTVAPDLEPPPTWVWPRFATAPAEERVLTLVDRWDYVEQRYEPPYTIDAAVPQGEARTDSPEAVMISRISAMMRSDYEEWLSHWDPASREFLAAKNAQQGETPQSWVARWDDRLRFMRFRMLRRIETGPYVIITYTLVTPQGEDATGAELELPVVFRRSEEEGRWFATQDLRHDALLAMSPWVSGQSIVELAVPW